MIIAILGNIGSGKSVYATKLAIESDYHCFINFKIKARGITRLKKEHIVREDVIGENRNGKALTKKVVNWDYWNEQLKKYGNYHLFLDEIHNLIHSRRSMSNWNVLCTMWISQIRKILGDKEDTHIFMISQRLQRIDVAFRDLLHMIVACQKFETTKKFKTRVVENGRYTFKMLPLVFILQYHFKGEACKEKYLLWMNGSKTFDYKTVFIANPYFQYYDSYEIFGETAYV